ncbi:MAG: hypothetical protein WAV46_02675 [Candidatus Moraniibacteriota bacterium]
MSEEKIEGGVESGKMSEDGSEKQPGDEGTLEIFPAQEKAVSAEGESERLEGKYNEILAKVAPQTATSGQLSDQDAMLDAKSISATVDEESKIQKLLDLASSKGVVYAVKVARSLQDYYALDRMHDELADKLYAGLLAKGLITKE